MRKSTEWILALGTVGIAILLASKQKKKEEEAMAEWVKDKMLHVTVIALNQPKE